MIKTIFRAIFSFGAVFCVGGTQAACPTPVGPLAWSNGIYVLYTFQQGSGGPPPNGFNPISWSTMPTTVSDIASAMGAWTTDNATFNSTLVQFVQTSAGAFRFFAYQVNYPGTPGLDPGVAAQTAMAHIVGTSILVQATTTFYYGSLSPLTGTLTMDPAAPGYDSFMSRVTLHEVGHTMGLTDQPLGGGFCAGQVAGQSVMNSNCGTNDSAGNIAASVTACDNASLW